MGKVISITNNTGAAIEVNVQIKQGDPWYCIDSYLAVPEGKTHKVPRKATHYPMCVRMKEGVEYFYDDCSPGDRIMLNSHGLINNDDKREWADLRAFECVKTAHAIDKSPQKSPKKVVTNKDSPAKMDSLIAKDFPPEKK